MPRTATTVRTPLRRSWAVLGTYLALTTVAYLYGEFLTIPLLTLIELVANPLLPDGMTVASLAVTTKDTGRFIALQAVTLTSVPVVAGIALPPGFSIGVATLQATTLHPLIVVLSLLAGWPAATVRVKAAQLMLGLPAVLAAVALDAPFVLAGLVHTGMLRAFAATEPARDAASTYLLFLQSGGRFGLAIAAACLVAFVVQSRCERHR